MSPQNLSGFQALHESIRTIKLNMNTRLLTTWTRFDNMNTCFDMQKQIKDFEDSFK